MKPETWTPAKDALPPTRHRVLLREDNGMIHVGTLTANRHGGKMWASGHRVRLAFKDVTHWCEIPAFTE